MSVIILLLIGIAAGFIATKVMGVNLSVAETVAIGLLGAIIGGVLLRGLIAVSGIAFGLIGAVIGACAMIWLYQRYFRRNR
ncbi:MAG: GlsB/YeaQ/YmgE family stress response membrane protein [Pseudomonadota bacterium]